MTPLLSLVPVPYVPPEPPPQTAATPLGWTLAGLGLAAIFGFCVIVIRAILNIPFRKNEIKVAAWLSFGGMALLGACYVDWRIHHYRQDLAFRTWATAERAARDEAERALGETYGITFDNWLPVLPFEESRWAREEPVTLPDGSPATCWFHVADQHYVVRCGTDESAATPLPAVKR